MRQAKLVICSDSHGSIEDICFEISKIRELSHIIHLGDYVRDAEEMELILNRPIIKVRGNNDYMAMTTPDYLELEISNHRFFLTHGHLFGVYSGIERLLDESKRRDCDICLFGHTHAFLDKELDGVRIINPGSINWPRGDLQKSFVVMDIDHNGNVGVKRIII